MLGGLQEASYIVMIKVFQCVSSNNMGQGLNRYPPSLCTVSKSNVPSVLPDVMSSSVRETWSPGLRGPTPDGVPVKIKSPSCRYSGLSIASDEGNGRRVRTSSIIIDEICSISLGIPKIISRVLPSCFTLLFTARVSLSPIGSFTSALGRKVVRIGVNPSKPFAADHGKPSDFTLDWRFRAVMSTARV